MTDVTGVHGAEGTFATLRQASGIDDDAGWHLPYYAYLVRHEGHTVVVGTGAGARAGADYLSAPRPSVRARQRRRARSERRARPRRQGDAASGRMVGFAHLGLGRVEAAGDGFSWSPAH